MIKQIEEINFGPGTERDYATLSNATVQLAEMGDRIITTQVKIDGDVVPDFEGWELRFRGERFVLDIKDPQAAKDNSSRNSIIDLTFYSWAILQLKRYFFFTAPSTATGIITVDKYQAPVTLTLENFVSYLNTVLAYYFHGKITAEVSVNPTDPENEAAVWDINYTKIWDVLQKLYELYGVRWRIEYVENTDSYVIKINFAAPAINDHEFEYGFQGGLMRFERQVQSADITNILLGRGGTRNVPYRYFKRTDPQNPEWAPDPDAIPELESLYIDRVRDINFRNYVQGWKTNPNKDLSWGDSVEEYDEVRGATDWAYKKGHEDTSFDPVEYVKDDESILKYGEHWGHLDDDDDIYPTIQGATVAGGPADLVVAVSDIENDNIEETTAAAANIVDLSNGVVNQTNDIEPTASDLDLQYEEIMGDTFTVPTGMTARLEYNDFFITADTNVYRLELLTVVTDRSRVAVFRSSDDVEVSPEGLTAGTYYYVIYVAIRNSNGAAISNATYGVNGLRLVQTAAGDPDAWKPTFDIWVRNIFETGKEPTETEEEYALRVWGPILGDHLGNEATVAFSDGQMSISEDYNFKIAAYPQRDDSKTITVGGVEYRSEWKITLYKTDAEFDATGYYVPNSTMGGKPLAGDHFYFIGIDMPHYYVVWAEQRVNDKKVLALYNTSDITPTWVVSLDKIRIDQEYNSDQERLFDKIEAGVKMFVYDKRFTKGRTLELYANSVTFTWSDDTIILPQTEVVLVDKIAVTKSQIAALQGDVSILRSSIAQMSDTENVVREAMKPLFLGKTGEEETSMSPTKFASLLTSEDFKQGGFGGRGWGFYRDNSMAYQNIEQVSAPTRSLRSAAPVMRSAASSDNETPATPSVRAGSQSVLEIDRLIVRRDMQVNNLVVNQIAYVGGKQIISAAAMECTQVVDGDGYYDCFFDQKQGTVKNLFQTGDIAMGQVFTADNIELRFYKMIVTKVGLDYIRLGKSPKNGSGVPKKGDVIVQYGSITNKARQYAIVRDVIGGGYERMLSDLDTIYSNGVEYYFAGLNANVNGDRQDLADNQDVLLADSDDKVLTVLAGAKPRFFVGNADSNIEFNAADGIFRLKGNIVQSPSGVEFPVPCFRDEYDPNEWYYYGDLVTYIDGASWIHIGKDRTKGTAPATGNIWRLYTASGKSNYRLDLSNETASINADAQGDILPGSVRPTCTATLYYGVDAVQNAVYSLTIPQGQNVQGVSINSSTGVMTFNAGDSGTPFNFSGNTLQLTVVATVTVGSQTTTAQAGMTITKNVPGAKGEPATSYWLVLSADKVSVDPNVDNPTPSPSVITAEAWLQIGEQAPRAAVAADGLTIKYKYDNGSYTNYPSGGITVDKTKTTLYIILYKDASVVDGAEAIPILWDGKNGESAVSADLDNEMDAIMVGSDGILDVAIPESNALVTNFRMFLGTQAQTLIKTGTYQVRVSGLPTGVQHSIIYSEDDTKATIKFWIPSVPVTLNTRYPITITGDCTINGTRVERSLTYILAGIKEGEDGTVYQLVPSVSQVRKLADGTLDPSTNVTCGKVKIKEGEATTTFDEGTITYQKDSGSETVGSSVSVSGLTSKIIFRLYIGGTVSGSTISGGTLVDQETIPLIKDGTNPVKLDLDNEMDTILTESNGKVSVARTVTTHATLYDGASVGTSATPVSTTASLTIGSVVPTVSMSNGVLTVSWTFATTHNLSAAATVSIVVAYRGTNYSAQFTIAPSMGRAIYQLKPDMSAIPFSRDASGNLTPASRSVGLTIVKLDGTSTASYTRASDAGVTVRYSTSAMPASASAGSSWTDGSIIVANTVTNLYLAMFDSSGVLLDRETVPVVKDGANGSPGKNGRLQRGPRQFDSTGSTIYQGYEDPYGAGGAGDIFYDVVYIDDPQHVGQILLFYCIQGDGANTHPPVSGGTQGYWAPANQFDFVATHVFLADNAKIKFLSGNDIYVTGTSGNNEVIYAGILGGTGVNFFAGPDTTQTGIAAQAANAAFRVDNAGNLYASNAMVKGKVITGLEPAQQGSYGGSSLVSLNGLFVSAGDVTVGDGDLIVSDGHLSARATGSGVLHTLEATYGNTSSKVEIYSSGSLYLQSQGTGTNLTRIMLTPTTATLSREGQTGEEIMSSLDLKHIVVCETETAYNNITDKRSDTLYIVKQ